MTVTTADLLDALRTQPDVDAHTRLTDRLKEAPRV